MGFIEGKIAEGAARLWTQLGSAGSKAAAQATKKTSPQTESKETGMVDRFAEAMVGKGMGQYAAKAVKGAARFLADPKKVTADIEKFSKDQIQKSFSATQGHLAKAKTHIAAGDFETGYRALSLAEGQVELLEQALPKAEQNSKVLVLRAHTKIIRGQLADLAGEATQATSHYKSAVKDLDIADQNSLLVSPIKNEILELRAQAKHQLRDYSGAMSDRFWQGQGYSLEGRTALRKYEHQLVELADEVEVEAFLAQDKGDKTQEALLVAEAVKINQALGREEVAKELGVYLTEVSKDVLPEGIKKQARAQVASGILTPELLASHKELDGLVVLDEAVEGAYALSFTQKFEDLSLADQIIVLEDLQKVGVEADIRYQAATQSDPAKQLYFQSKVAMMDGNLEGAKIHMMDLKAAATGSKDDEVLAMANEAKGQLRAYTLAHLAQMEQYNQSLFDQRDRGGLIKADNPKEKRYQQMNERLIRTLTSYVEMGQADTLDEALAKLHAEAEQARAGSRNKFHDQLKDQFDSEVVNARQLESYLYAAENPEAFEEFAKGDQMAQKHGDEYFLALLKTETREELSLRTTEEGRREALLATGDKLRNGWASYEIAGQYYGALFQQELSSAVDGIPQDTIDLIKRRNRNGFDVYKMKETVQAQLEDLKERDPLLYQERFPHGEPTKAQLDGLVEEAVQAKIEFDIQKEAYKVVDARYQNGEMSDSVASEAWHKYKDMTDCVDEWGNLSDEAWDQVLQETVIMAITLPATMGAGAAVRGGIAGSKWALRAASVTRMGTFGVRAVTFGAGSLTEGLVMEMQHAALSGEFHAKNVGFNVVMSGVFHGGGKLWAGYADELGLGAMAQQTVQSEGKVWAARGMKTVDFAGTMGTQTLLGTLVSDPGNSQNLGDNLAANFARNLGFHYGAMSMRGLMPNVMAWEGQGMARQQAAQQAYLQARSSGFTPKASQDFAVASVLPQAAPKTVGPQLITPSKEKPYGMKEFVTDSVEGANYLWRSVEQFLFGNGSGPMGPAYAMATAGAAVAPRPMVRKGRSGSNLVEGLLQVFRKSDVEGFQADASEGGTKRKTGAYETPERKGTVVLSGDQKNGSSPRVGKFLSYDKAVERGQGQLRGVRETLMGLSIKFRESNIKVKVKRTPEKELQPDDSNFHDRGTGELLSFEIQLNPDMKLSSMPKDARHELYMEGLSLESIKLFNGVEEAMGMDNFFDPAAVRESLSPAQQKRFDPMVARIRRAQMAEGAEAFRRLMDGLGEGNGQFHAETLALVQKDGLSVHRARYEVARQKLLPEQLLYFDNLVTMVERGGQITPEEMLNQLRQEEGMNPLSDWVALRPNQMANRVAQIINEKGWNEALGQYEFQVPLDGMGRPFVEINPGSHDVTLDVWVHLQRVRSPKGMEYLPVNEAIQVTLTLPRDNVAMFDVTRFGGKVQPRALSVEELVTAADAPKPEPKPIPKSVPLDSADGKGPSIFRLDGGKVAKY